MISVDETLFSQEQDVFKDIESKALYQLQELNTAQVVQDDIFRILKNIKGLHLLKFPIEDQDLTAFTIQKEDTFIFINSHLPLEKQIFGAAHELYHVLYPNGDNKKEEVLKDIEVSFNGDLSEKKANSFAACFLVPKHHLIQTINNLKINKEAIELIDIIKLMDVFAVPYKSLILRLYEINLLEKKQAEKLLLVPDRNPKKGILLLINQTRHAIRWQKVTVEYEYSNFIELLINNYKENIISFKQLKADFSKIINNENVENYLEE